MGGDGVRLRIENNIQNKVYALNFSRKKGYK